MNFIEANQIVKKNITGKKVHIRLASSATIDPFIIYLKATAALQGQIADVMTLPFGTMGQSLLTSPDPGVREIFVLMPWDLVPEYDWRSGIPTDIASPENLLNAANIVVGRLAKRKSSILYLDAPVPPLYLNPTYSAIVKAGILQLIATENVRVLDPKYFNLGSYLSSGLPFTSAFMGDLAKEIMAFTGRPASGCCKVLITDLDNVIWNGLAAEDGPKGVLCTAEGKGFRHFIYQGFLAKLKASGILLAAVSRNDLVVASAPIVQGYTLLKQEDFIEILASYEPKSVHIKRLAKRLNLGMDSFVFVDDNPVELAEVGTALPAVKCVQFPEDDERMASFLREIAMLFERNTISSEDRDRTEMYRRMLNVQPSADLDENGGDLKGFLEDLRMELIIYDRSKADRERAVQLINKTNQFNINGRRTTEEEVDQIIQAGGKLYTAKLNDRTGTHGEILVCLIDENKRISSFVMSCRIFQRRVEYAFVCWLIKKISEDVVFLYSLTERNTPVREFFKDEAIIKTDDGILLTGNTFLLEHADDAQLFKMEEVGFE